MFKDIHLLVEAITYNDSSFQFKMARTKQTALKSTGGSAPKKQLAAKAAILKSPFRFLSKMSVENQKLVHCRTMIFFLCFQLYVE